MALTAELSSQISKLVGSEMKKYLDPLQETLVKLQAPASRVGMTPEAFLAKQMEKGGDGHGLILGGDGSATPFPYDLNGKRLGWGEMWRSVYGLSTGKGTTEQNNFHEKYLKSIGVEPAEIPGSRSKAALAENSGITGGYTVPPQFAAQLLRLAIEDELIEPLASKMPMTAMTLQVPSLDMTTTYGAGQSPFLGAVQATWSSESSIRTESEPQFRQTELKANELSFIAIASNILLADSAIALDALLTQLFSQAIAWYKDYAFLRGTGTGQPLGLLNCPATIRVTRTLANYIKYPDICNMYAKIYFPLFKSGKMVWLAHQSTIPQFLQMNDQSGSTSGQSTGRVLYVSYDQGAQKGPEWRLFGIPLYFTEKLPALGTTGDLMLLDVSKYLIGKRMEIEVSASPIPLFRTNQMMWRVIIRVDGQPWLNGPITLADGAQTVSPFVALN